LVDGEYDSGGNFITHSGPDRITINQNRLNFIDAYDRNPDIRAHRMLNQTLCDYWITEFDFEVVSDDPAIGLTQQVAYIPFSVTENDEHPYAKRNPGYQVTNNNALGVLVNANTTTNNTNVLKIAPFWKIANTNSNLGHQMWANAMNHIAIDEDVAYHVIFERIDLEHGRLTVSANGFHEVMCFDIDPNVTNLKHLQHSNNPLGGWHRYVNGWVDNVCILDCTMPEDCSTAEEQNSLSMENTALSNSFNDSKVHSLTVYPNPAKNHVEFRLENQTITQEKGELTIVDLSQRLVHSSAVDLSKTIKVNVQDFSEGTYLYTIKSASQILNGKFVVSH